MFKVNNKDTKTKSLTSFWFLYCYLWTYFAHCPSVSVVNIEHVTAGWEEAITAQKMKFSMKDFFSKCDKISNFWRISSHLLRKSLMENLIFLCSALSLTYVPLKNTSWKIPGDKEAEKKKKKWILKEIIATAKVKAILKLKVRFRNVSSFEQNFFSEYVWHQQL